MIVYSFHFFVSSFFQEVLVGNESFSLEEQRPITGARGIVHLLMDGQDEVVQLNEELPRGFSITYHGSTQPEVLVHRSDIAPLKRFMPPKRLHNISKVRFHWSEMTARLNTTP